MPLPQTSARVLFVGASLNELDSPVKRGPPGMEFEHWTFHVYFKEPRTACTEYSQMAVRWDRMRGRTALTMKARYGITTLGSVP